MFDKLRAQLRAYGKYWQQLSTDNELFPTKDTLSTSHWSERLIGLINGQKAAERTKEGWHALRTQGVRQTFWPLLFMLGLALGFGVKGWAEDRITIGYADYQLEKSETLYDLNALEMKFLTEQENPREREKKQYPADVIE